MRKILVLLALTVTVSTKAQTAIEDITPKDPGIAAEVASGSGASMYDMNVFVLFNKGGTQSLGLWTKNRRWYSIPLPKKAGKILDLAGGDTHCFILMQGEDGANEIHRWISGRWERINLKKLNGKIAYMKLWGTKGVMVYGDFRMDGKPYVAAGLYVDEWSPFPESKVPAQILDAVTQSTIEKIYDYGTILLKNNTTGKYQVLKHNPFSRKDFLSAPLPGPVTDVVTTETVHVLGKDGGTGKTYLVEVDDAETLPVDLSQSPLGSIDRMYRFDKYDLSFEGLSKTDGKRSFANATHFKVDKGLKWGKTYLLPEMEGYVQTAETQMPMMIDKSNHHLYTFGLGSAKAIAAGTIAESKFGPITEIADKSPHDLNTAVALKKIEDDHQQRIKELNAPINNIDDVINLFARDADLHAKLSLPEYTNSSKNRSPEATQKVKAEATSISASMYSYLLKIDLLKDVQPQDTALRTAFKDFLLATQDRAKYIMEGITSIQNSDNGVSQDRLRTLARGTSDRYARVEATERRFRDLHAARNSPGKSSLKDAFKAMSDSLKKTMN